MFVQKRVTVLTVALHAELHLSKPQEGEPVIELSDSNTCMSNFKGRKALLWTKYITTESTERPGCCVVAQPRENVSFTRHNYRCQSRVIL